MSGEGADQCHNSIGSASATRLHGKEVAVRQQPVTVLIEQKASAAPDRADLLAEQVRRAGHEPVIVAGKSNAELLDRVVQAAAVGPVAVIDSSFVTTQAMLNMLLDQAWAGHSALVTPDRQPAFDLAVRVGHKRVLSSATEFHRVTAPTHRALGMLRIAPSREVVRTLLAARPFAESQVMDLDGVGLLTVILVRGNIPVAAVEPTGPTHRQGGAVDDSLATITLRDDDAIRLARATRSNDGFYSTFVLRRFSRILTWVAVKRGWTPNQITVASLIIAVIAAALFADGSRTSLLVGAVLVQLAIIVDCSDGEVARYHSASSQLGAWLDAATDRVKEYALYAGLAAGASNGQSWYWTAAMALVVMQTVRHLSDYNFVAIRATRETADLSLPLISRRAVHWVKRVIYLPIGERWLIISVGAALGSVKAVFLTLFVAGMFGLAYVIFGRIMRSASWRRDVANSGCDIVERQLDGGPLLRRLVPIDRHPLAGPLGWAVPSLLRGVELGLVVIVGHQHPVAYLWLFAVAFHHYDTMYRSLEGVEFPQQLTDRGLGIEGRIALVALIAFGLPAEVAWFVGGWYFTAVLVGQASWQWAASLRSSQRAR